MGNELPKPLLRLNLKFNCCVRNSTIHEDPEDQIDGCETSVQQLDSSSRPELLRQDNVCDKPTKGEAVQSGTR